MASSSSAASKVEAVVIGAGVVGLAVARALAIAGKEVLVIDKASRYGSETSSRNSEVVHAGLYYPQDSLKAKLCVQGRNMMYSYCDSRSISYNRCGKLIVATEKDQVGSTLLRLQEQARHNGVTDVKLLNREEVKAIEPEVETYGALWSPSTGIVDSHALMMSLLADAEEHGATLALHSEVSNGNVTGDEIMLSVDEMWLSCDSVINCAGLWAHQVADRIHTGHSWQPPRQYFAKGTYFQLQGPSPFSHLIYPVPDCRGGLGVHATIDRGGQVKFGPDVEWQDPGMDNPDAIDFSPDPTRADSFYQSIRKYWPGLVDDALVPDYTGVRPKLSHPTLVESMSFQDFSILKEDTHKVPGLVHLLGIESPGLTSAMAIADYIVKDI
jgi:L-2-hydroxyglutarate oxidase LhgO